MLMNVKKPTLFGILTYMSMINCILSSVEHAIFFIISGPAGICCFAIPIKIHTECQSMKPGEFKEPANEPLEIRNVSKIYF